jgi:tRNA-dihydrouridine synthase A
VQKGAFGACLMREPDLVAACVSEMQNRVRVPVTVKCRIGVDEQEPREALFGFVEKVARAGCSTFVVHARKAWLKGVSPKDNRDLPPLDYDLVYALKAERPDLTIIINGGITTLAEAEQHLARVDGVMMGRAAYQTPWIRADADRALFGEAALPRTRHEAVVAFMPYMARELHHGTPLNAMTKHLLGLFNGVPGARAFRRHLSENAVKPGAGLAVVEAALAFIRDDAEERAAA